MLGTLNAKHRKGIQTLSNQRKMSTTLGYIRPWRKPPNFWKVGIVRAIFSYHNLINHSCLVEQAKFNNIQVEKKFIFSPCCLFRLVLCWLLLLQTLDEISGRVSHISSQPWIKQTNQKTSIFSHKNCPFSVIKMCPFFSVKASPLPCSVGAGKPVVGEVAWVPLSHFPSLLCSPQLPGLRLLTPQVRPRGSRCQGRRHSLTWLLLCGSVLVFSGPGGTCWVSQRSPQLGPCHYNLQDRIKPVSGW